MSHASTGVITHGGLCRMHIRNPREWQC